MLKEQERIDIVRYRLENAHKTLKEVDLLIQNGLFNTAANRMYYACFYAALALLVANGIATASHAGVKTMLGLHFVSKGLLDIQHGKTFSRLFEIRHTGDYDDFVYCDKEMAKEYTPKAEAFINRIKELLEDK